MNLKRQGEVSATLYTRTNRSYLLLVPSTTLLAGNSPPSHALCTRKLCASLFSLKARESGNLNSLRNHGQMVANLSHLMLISSLLNVGHVHRTVGCHDDVLGTKMKSLVYVHSPLVAELLKLTCGFARLKRWRSQAVKNRKNRAHDKL